MYEIDRKLLIKQGEKLTEIGYSGKTSRRCDDKEDDDGNDGDIHHHDDNSNNNNNNTYTLTYSLHAVAYFLLS